MESPWARRSAWALAALTCWLALYEINVLLDIAPERGMVFGGAAHLIISFTAGALCLAAALRREGSERVGWLLVGAGIVAWNAGDTYWTEVLLDEDSIPVPSLADIGYLTFTALSFAGLLMVLHARVKGAPRTLWVDGVTASLATAAVAAAIVVPKLVAFSGAEWNAIATNAAYPISDLILLGLVVGAIGVRAWRLDRTWGLAGLGILAFWIADTHYLFALADGSYAFPDPLDAGWTLAFLGLAAASWQPVRQSSAVERLGRRAAVLPLVFAATALGVLVYGGVAGTTPVAIGLAAASMAAVGVRLWLTFRDHVAMLET